MCSIFEKKNMPSLELQVELETCTQNTCATLGFWRYWLAGQRCLSIHIYTACPREVVPIQAVYIYI